MEQYHTVYPEWNGSALTQPRREVSSEFHTTTMEKEWNTPQNAHYHFCLISTYTILFMLITLHKSGHCSKHNEQMYSPLNTIPGKIRNRY